MVDGELLQHESDGVVVYEIGNVTFIHVGCAADYADEIGAEFLDVVVTRFVRYGISHATNYTRPSAPP